MFLKNHTQNVIEILFPDPFLKSQNLAYIWINILKFHKACFYGMPTWRLSEQTETKLQTSYLYLYKAFLRNKRSGTILPILFSTWLFEEKYFSYYILLPDQSSLSNCLFCLYMCNVNCLLTRIWRHKFWN